MTAAEPNSPADEQVGVILVLGLDQAGKTSILTSLQSGDFHAGQKPTLGVNILRTFFNNLNLVCYDVGGQASFRDRWFSTVDAPDAIVYVVDLSNEERVAESKAEFAKVAQFLAGQATTPPLLVLGNKMDLVGQPKLIADILLRKGLGLNALEYRPRKIRAVSAKTGASIQEAFHWLVMEILKQAN